MATFKLWDEAAGKESGETTITKADVKIASMIEAPPSPLVASGKLSRRPPIAIVTKKLVAKS